MTDAETVINEIVDGMRLEVELVDGTVHTVPISMDFSSFTKEDAEWAVQTGDNNAARLSAAFVALKANQTMHLPDDDLSEVVDVLAGMFDGDETNMVVT